METLAQALQRHFPQGEIQQTADGETLQVAAADLLAALAALRDSLGFAQLIDIVGLDYSELRGHGGPRFAALYNLLSLEGNRRVRVRVFCEDDGFPVLPSAVALWRAAGWFEREAFDLFGIVFDGNDDLRRILTDYGFSGHPFRKDFPLSGHVEMRYDPQQKRVVYQPVSIPPREVTPRVVREETYGGGQGGRGGSAAGA